MRHTTSFLAVSVLVFGGITSAHAQLIPIDDFDDMDDTLPGWTLVDFSDGQPWGPGSYDPSSGALRVSHTGDQLIPPGTPFTESAMFALWDDSTDPLYSNGFYRAKIRTDEAQNSTSLEMRLDLSTATTYILFGFTQPPTEAPEFDGVFIFSKFVNGVEEVLWTSGENDIEYLVGEDWNAELGAVGNRISAKVWRVGDPEPAAPQFQMIDLDPIIGGQLGISSDRTIANKTDARGDGTFDDIVFFAVPEPASITLILVAMCGFLALRR
jgi:hypothetical protein